MRTTDGWLILLLCVIALGEIVSTGCVQGPSSLIYVSGGSNTMVLGPLPVPVDGKLAISTPALLGAAQNLSAIFQFVVVSGQALNGSYASTEAHEIQF